MKRLLALAVVAAMLAVPAVSAADWPQAGYDAARTGDVPEAGPAWNDTVFTTRLPGDLWHIDDLPSEPIIVDRTLYVAVEPGDDDREAQGIARVDLETAEVDMLVETETPPQGIASADGLLVASHSDGMAAYDLEIGETAWTSSPPDDLGISNGIVCLSPAIEDGSVIAPCSSFEGAGLQAFAWAMDLGTGETEWSVRLQPATSTQAESTGDVTDRRPSQVSATLGISTTGQQALAVTIAQDYVADCSVPDPLGTCGTAVAQETRMTLWGIAGGDVAWRNSTEVSELRSETADVRAPISEDLPTTSLRPTGAEGVVYTKFDDKIQQINPAQGGEVLWEEPLGQQDAVQGLSGAGAALIQGEALYVSSLQTLSKYDLTGPVPSLEWRYKMDTTRDEFILPGSIIEADDTVYLVAGGLLTHERVHAVDGDTGEQAWTHRVNLLFEEEERRPVSPFMYAMADGLLTLVGEDGTIHVIGETDASLGAPSVESERYPDAGETVTIDASDTDPGAFGEANRYMVDWGDGTVSGWQASPTFTQAYQEEGTYDARVHAGNDGNQTASAPVAMHVGQEEPNWLSERFEPGNQDMTFGILGVVLALGGGAFGVARRKRRKSLLEDELDALEEGYEETKDRPSECEAFLDNRKARARSLALDDKLDEQQVSILENRADELRGELRVSMLDERFAFLPHGMVRTLERMLEDGRINAWEKETFLNALDEQEMLTEEQKGKVERLIGQWLDEGGVER